MMRAQRAGSSVCVAMILTTWGGTSATGMASWSGMAVTQGIKTTKTEKPQISCAAQNSNVFLSCLAELVLVLMRELPFGNDNDQCRSREILHLWWLVWCELSWLGEWIMLVLLLKPTRTSQREPECYDGQVDASLVVEAKLFLQEN